MTTAENVEVRTTCCFTLVRAGRSDRKIKIYPAKHSEEKVWLDNIHGRERWEEIERIINLHAPRTGVIPKPVPICTEDLKTVTLKDSDIPVIKLEGHTLSAPLETVSKVTPSQANTKDMPYDKRLSDLENTVTNLAGAVTNLISKIDSGGKHERKSKKNNS